MKDNPPYADDKPALEKLKKLGIEPGKPFNITKVDAKVAAGLAKAVKEVQIKMAGEIPKIKNVDGWINMTTLGRYAIAPWMPLKFNPDGSLDIYLQAESPGPDKESNWLPTPPGQFNLTLRNYFPKDAAWDGTYRVPPVKQVQ